MGGVMITALLVLSLVTIGLAHKPGFTSADASRAAFAQFWGQPDPVYCGSFGKGDATKGTDCPACRLLAGMDLPPPPVASARPAFSQSPLQPALDSSTDVSRPRDPAIWVRGPPAALV